MMLHESITTFVEQFSLVSVYIRSFPRSRFPRIAFRASTEWGGGRGDGKQFVEYQQQIGRCKAVAVYVLVQHYGLAEHQLCTPTGCMFKHRCRELMRAAAVGSTLLGERHCQRFVTQTNRMASSANTLPKSTCRDQFSLCKIDYLQFCLDVSPGQIW